MGYEVDAATAAARLALHAPDDPIFLAEDASGAAIGLLALQFGRMIQHAGPYCRIATLSVAEAARGRGIGRLLVDHAEALARAAGCLRVELTSGNHREGAHAFYRALGFVEGARYFSK